MPFVDYDNREIDLKIAWVGPRRSGKTTALRSIEDSMEDGLAAGWLPSHLAGDRPLLFEVLPLQARAFEGFAARFELMTLPDGDRNRLTRSHLLRELDGVVFMADSAWNMMEENARAMSDLRGELSESGHAVERMPMVLLYNKRDHREAAPLEYMEFLLNGGSRRLYSVATNASSGKGLIEGLNAIAKYTLAAFDMDPEIELTSSANRL